VSKQVDLSTVVEFLNSELNVSQFRDAAFNGLQIESRTRELTAIAFAVDAGYSVMEEAVRRGAQLLVVHHGVLWGKSEPVVGPWARKLSLCLESGLSLYASHLPLDGHPTIGNAAVIAKDLLAAENVTPAFEYQGSSIGVTATFNSPVNLESVVDSLTKCPGALQQPLVLPFGKALIMRIGIVTGSGTFLIPEASRRGLDLLITGEPKQEAYHVAKEHGMSVVCMGHYASETFGVRSLQRILEQRFGVKTEWIDEPTGI
jgi:dinuclear metal center YbgI/SA1388 family protein